MSLLPKRELWYRVLLVLGFRTVKPLPWIKYSWKHLTEWLFLELVFYVEIKLHFSYQLSVANAKDDVHKLINDNVQENRIIPTRSLSKILLFHKWLPGTVEGSAILSVMWCDRAPARRRRDILLGGAICGWCIWLPWRQLAECPQETELDLRQKDSFRWNRK